VGVGDGEQDEGQIWEAASYASYHELANLLAVTDRNGIQVDGATRDILDLEPLAARWNAFGWRVAEVDGHDLGELMGALEAYEEHRSAAGPRGQPTMIVARTVGGKGIPF